MDKIKEINNTRNYAYIRVSTKEQNVDRQIDAILKLGVDIDSRNIFIDHWTGTTIDRPYYQALKYSIRPGDTLYINNLDRLGRNKSMIKDEWTWFINNNIDIVVIDTPLISTTNYKDMGSMGKFISDLILEILSWLAEEEISNLKQRQMAGIESAKAKGVQFGRPRIEIDTKFIETYNKWKTTGMTAVEAMEECGMTKSTFYRRVGEYEESIGMRKDQTLDEEVLALIEDLKTGRITKDDLDYPTKNKEE